MGAGEDSHCTKRTLWSRTPYFRRLVVRGRQHRCALGRIRIQQAFSGRGTPDLFRSAVGREERGANSNRVPNKRQKELFGCRAPNPAQSEVCCRQHQKPSGEKAAERTSTMRPPKLPKHCQGVKLKICAVPSSDAVKADAPSGEKTADQNSICSAHGGLDAPLRRSTPKVGTARRTGPGQNCNRESVEPRASECIGRNTSQVAPGASQRQMCDRNMSQMTPGASEDIDHNMSQVAP